MANICIIGDLMLDYYVNCTSDRISPEAPVPVLKPLNTKVSLGGAANVAANLAVLGHSVTLISAIGRDETGGTAIDMLKAMDIKLVNLGEAYQTIRKTRFLVGSYQVLRLDNETKFTEVINKEMAAELIEQLSSANLIVISDYDKGLISNNIMDLVRSSNTRFLVDPKAKDWSIYKDAFLISPNKKELNLAIGIDIISIEEAVKFLSKKFNLSNIVTTLSEDGMSVYSGQGDCQTIEASANEVVDVTGAGDIVIAVLADQISKETDILTAAKLANKMAGQSVQKIGTQVLGQGQISEVQDQAASAEKVVFTNGCFDILHAGHVDFLQRAKSYGDKLVIGLNSDSSVQALKGKSRPINCLENRKKVLEALDCVDAVIEFHEDTPEILIKKVKPEVLAKGADWTGKEIAGADFVTSLGGKVVLLEFKYQTSTTEIINRVHSHGENI